MRLEEFDRLVKHLEGLAASHPRLYKVKTGLLALIGYAHIFGVLAVVAALLAVLAVSAVKGRSYFHVVKTGIPLIVLAGIILRSLWVRLRPPEGIPLGREEAERLFDAVEKIRRAVKGPRVHAILLTDDFNAAVVQVPRLGIIGWHKNYLTVGLPLMHALSPAQFEAVLAHEIGHLSAAHGRFGAWIYRIRKTWYRLVEAPVAEVRGDAAALPLYREIAATDENCADAHHAVGRILLSAGDERGIPHLEKARRFVGIKVCLSEIVGTEKDGTVRIGNVQGEVLVKTQP